MRRIVNIHSFKYPSGDVQLLVVIEQDGVQTVLDSSYDEESGKRFGTYYFGEELRAWLGNCDKYNKDKPEFDPDAWLNISLDR